VSNQITPLQTLALWSLLVNGGSGLQKDIKSTFEKKDREALAAAGLITWEKNKKQAFVLTVTDKGWHWAGTAAIDCAVARSPAAADVLRGLIAHLGVYMQARNIPLAEILAAAAAPPTATEPQPSPPPVPTSPQPTDLRERIRAAFLKLTGDKFNTRVRLADLRALLSDLDRATQDEAIFAVAHESDADLLQLDNRIDITDADREAALQVGNEPRHLLWISK
jgi:hypothetical protein